MPRAYINDRCVWVTPCRYLNKGRAAGAHYVENMLELQLKKIGLLVAQAVRWRVFHRITIALPPSLLTSIYARFFF